MHRKLQSFFPFNIFQTEKNIHKDVVTEEFYEKAYFYIHGISSFV